MNYWRMQLHPDDAIYSAFYAYQSIGKGFIGLGFANNVGDLLAIKSKDELGTQAEYLPFASEMKKGDVVLIMAHHNPIAVVKIKSDYNYIKNTIPELGFWFNHFRQIDTEVIYYADFMTNAKNTQSLVMTNTIQKISADTQSAQLIQQMIDWEKENYAESIYHLTNEEYLQKIDQ